MPAKTETLIEVDGQQPALTNLDKVLYPATGNPDRRSTRASPGPTGVGLPAASRFPVSNAAGSDHRPPAPPPTARAPAASAPLPR